jgi:hypothetical protein
MAVICIITSCANEISPRSTLDICPLCRQTLYRWRQRRPAEILERRRKLTMYQSRMDNVNPNGVKK